jgi:hypothetical protein
MNPVVDCKDISSGPYRIGWRGMAIMDEGPHVERDIVVALHKSCNE